MKKDSSTIIILVMILFLPLFALALNRLILNCDADIVIAGDYINCFIDADDINPVSIIESIILTLVNFIKYSFLSMVFGTASIIPILILILIISVLIKMKFVTISTEKRSKMDNLLSPKYASTALNITKGIVIGLATLIVIISLLLIFIS